MGRIVAWLMIMMGCVILGFNVFKWWGEINIAVKDPTVAMTISDDWQETVEQPAITSVDNFNAEQQQNEDIQNILKDQEELAKNQDQENSSSDDASQKEANNQDSSSQNEQQSSSNQQKSENNPTQQSSNDLTIGSNVGQLIIPKIGAYLPIIEGTDPQSLEKGVGKFRGYGTVSPNQTGHVVLSGHRDTVFRKVGELKVGDKMYVKFKDRVYTYQMRKTWITHAEDRTVIVPIPRPVLTVTTCYPFDYVGNAPDRYIMRAELIRIQNV